MAEVAIVRVAAERYGHGMDRQLWTIGYEKAAFASVLASLRQAGVRRVIDVRALPLSRRPGFSKRHLAAGLAEAGIGYIHLRALGTPAPGREANRRRQWPLFWQIVDAQLAKPDARMALEEAACHAASEPSVLLCYEADAAICHRCRVATLLAERHGFVVRHLAALTSK